MNNDKKFLAFLESMRKSNPVLIEAVKSGFKILHEVAESPVDAVSTDDMDYIEAASLAGEFHGGQNSALYSFSSTGELWYPISDYINELKPFDTSEYADDANRLIEFFQAQEDQPSEQIGSYGDASLGDGVPFTESAAPKKTIEDYLLKWSKRYHKADMSEWSDVINAAEQEIDKKFPDNEISIAKRLRKPLTESVKKQSSLVLPASKKKTKQASDWSNPGGFAKGVVSGDSNCTAGDAGAGAAV